MSHAYFVDEPVCLERKSKKNKKTTFQNQIHHVYRQIYHQVMINFCLITLFLYVLFLLFFLPFFSLTPALFSIILFTFSFLIQHLITQN